MKKLNMYYVYDKVGETVIAGPIPAANDFVALIGFRDAYIKKPSLKMPYSYKALQLVRFTTFDVTEEGCYSVSDESKIEVFEGTEVMQRISEQCVEFGIEDTLVDEPQVDLDEAKNQGIITDKMEA